MKKRPEKEPNNERWLLTYSDLITLLMVFFVILYAMSNVSSSKYKAVSDSFRSVMGGGGNIIADSNGDGDSVTPIQTEQQKFDDMQKDMDKYISEYGLGDSVSTYMEDKGLIIRFNDSMIFDTGKADVKEDVKNKLIKISNVINKVDNYIRVEGHTDNVPIKNDQYKSNWQLSSIRSSNVGEFLIDYGKISPQRVSVVGYGEYKPVEQNTTDEGRNKNRRVEIIILNSKYNELEITK